MGKMGDLLISGSSNEEMKAMIDNARNQHDAGYIQFLESQLEKSEKITHILKELLRKTLGPGYCVECFKYLSKDEIICGKCQDECDGRWDHLRE